MDLNIVALERIGIFDPKLPPTKLSFRLSFMSNCFDYDTTPSMFSEDLEFKVDQTKKQLTEAGI